ncbi:SusC/RagA family TonB-linked outer membrane protein [Sphingobacterium sp. HSC-15S19]|uniref:SusC/RagA family TonB-linked outer membrane protein n=1 Tax=Sphingobacterium TaxID=28453 RepID=UPI003D25E021
MRKQCFVDYKGAVLTVLCLMSCLYLSAQEFSGRVTSKIDGKPLPYATVKVNNNTVKSNEQGQFKIDLKTGDIVEVSLLGYEKLTYTVTKKGFFTVQLQPKEGMLDEVVVTALGLKREAKGLTYSTQKVSAEAVSGIRDNSGNFVSALSGKVAGAVINTTSGGPGSSARIVLRGNKSITGNNNALIVIDGIVFDNSSTTQSASPFSNVYSSSDGGANINPEDIESINVLKGPSAAALYGSRAVNGAIIITTKKGAAGSWKLDLNSTHSIESASYIPSLQNAYGRGNAGVRGDNAVDSWGEKSTAYPDNVKHFFNAAYSNNNSLSASGGTDKVASFFSVNNSRIGGLIPNNYMTKNGLDLRINTELIKNLKTDLKLSYLDQDIKNKQRLSANGVLATLYTMPRDMSDDELNNYEVFNQSTGITESLFWSTNVNNDNPFWTVNRTSVNEKRKRTNGIGSVSYQFFPWMNFMTRFSFDTYNETTDGAFNATTKSNGTIRAGGMYYLTESKYSNTNLDLLLTGGSDLGNENFHIDYVLGSSFLNRKFDTHTDEANGLVIPNRFSLSFAASPAYINLLSYDRQLNSVFGSVNLMLWKALYVDITGRNDWSSTLPSPHSYFYPSAGLSVLLNEVVHLPTWINMGKIRTSYTKVGNDADPNLLNQTYYYVKAAGDGAINRSATQNISNLKPEQTLSFEAGFDLQMFDNRVNLNGTYYKTNSKNQLMYLTVPYATGYQTKYVNAGNIQNQGFELQLQTTPVKTEHFTWNSNFNFARNISKVVSLNDQVSSVNISENIAYASVVVAKGGAYGDLYSYIWKKDAATDKYVVDAQGLPVVEAGKKVGNYNPSSTLGWSNSFKYKNFGLNIHIDGRIGGEMVSGTAAMLADYGVADFTEKFREGGLVLDAVDASGNQNTTAVNAETFWTKVAAGGIYPYGQFFTFDMTNFRIRNIGASYDLPAKVIPGIRALQFNFSVNNVLFLYKGKSILDIPGLGKIANPVDPESSIGSGNFQGVEAGVLPLSRTFTLGLKASF